MQKIIIIFFIFSLLTLDVDAKTTNIVNVLTWRGYLDEVSTSELVKRQCGAILSYDTYATNEDMLRRWHLNSDKYDLLIFAGTTYNAIKEEIVLNNSELWKNSRSYHPEIRKAYNSRHFPHNIAFFAHSITGLIWNPHVIELTKDDTIQSAFKKAKNYKVILLDEPVEIGELLSAATNREDQHLANHISIEYLRALTQEAQIYISNELNQIYNDKDFAFSYQWLGGVFSNDNNIKNYQFFINKDLSYVTSDLIAQVKDNKVVSCVAGVLSSKKFLSKVQSRARYFSPYGDVDGVPEGKFKQLYRSFLEKLPQLRWIKSLSVVQLNKLNKQWSRVKYDLMQNRE